MKNTAGVCHSGWGCETPKERQPATYFNKKGDRSLPKINYYVAYEKNSILFIYHRVAAKLRPETRNRAR